MFLSLLAYLPVLNLVPLLKRQKARFLLFHSRQGLYLFSVFLVLIVALVAVAYVFLLVLDAPTIIRTLIALLVVVVVFSYVLLVLLMAISVLQKKMVMLPVLGEMAGER